MNKIFIFGITIGAIVLLILIIFVTIFQQRPDQSFENTVALPQPTTVPNVIPNSDTRPTLSPEETRTRFRSLTDTQVEALEELKTKAESPVKTEDFELEYSDTLDVFYITQLTDNADTALKEFFDDEELNSLYDNNETRSLFKIQKNKNTRTQDEIEALRERDRQIDILLKPTATPNFSSDTQKQIDILKGLTETMFDFSVPIPDITNQPDNEIPILDFSQGIISNNQPTSITPTSAQQSQTTAYGSDALNKIINEASQKVGTPVKIIKAVMSVECPLTFKLSDAEVNRYSQPGNGVPFCAGKPPYYDSGPMQFITTTWPYYSNSVNKYGGYTHTPYVMNIRDSIYAGAVLLKKASKTPISKVDNWTYQEVLRTITCYNAGCGKYPDRISDKVMRYFNRVWKQYTQ